MSTKGPGSPEPTLTSAQVAAMFNVDSKTVTRWAKAGKIKPALLTLGGHRRYRESDVLKLLKGGGPTRFQVRYWADGATGQFPAVRGTFTNPQAAEAALAKATEDGYDRPWLMRWDPAAGRWERVSDAS